MARNPEHDVVTSLGWRHDRQTHGKHRFEVGRVCGAPELVAIQAILQPRSHKRYLQAFRGYRRRASSATINHGGKSPAMGGGVPVRLAGVLQPRSPCIRALALGGFSADSCVSDRASAWCLSCALLGAHVLWQKPLITGIYKNIQNTNIAIKIW